MNTKTKRLWRASWLIPAIVAAVAFIGGVSGSLIAEYIKPLAEQYRLIVWAIFVFALLLSVVGAIHDSGNTRDVDDTPSDAGVSPLVDALRTEWQYVRRLSTSASGRLILSITEDSVLRLWSIPDGKLIFAFLVRKTVRDADISSDGEYVLVGFDEALPGFGDEVKVIHSPSGNQERTQFVGPDQSIVALWGRSDSFIVATSSQLLRYSYQVEEKSLLFQMPFTVNMMALSPNGEYIAAGSNESGVAVGTIRKGLLASRFHVGESLQALAISSDGATIACGSPAYDGVRIIDTISGREILRGHTDQVSSVAFSANGKLLAAGDWDGGLYLYEAPDWERRAAIRAHERKVGSVVFCQKDRYLVSGGGFDAPTIQIWDMKTQQLVRTISGVAAQ